MAGKTKQDFGTIKGTVAPSPLGGRVESIVFEIFEDGKLIDTVQTDFFGKFQLSILPGIYTIRYSDTDGQHDFMVVIQARQTLEIFIRLDQENDQYRQRITIRENYEEASEVMDFMAASISSRRSRNKPSSNRPIYNSMRLSFAAPVGGGAFFDDPKETGPVFTSDDFNTEDYGKIIENPFQKAGENPVSTFSVDVDTASYSNVRRFLKEGRMPPQDAVRLEEFINYFDYQYPQPAGEHPVAIHTELAACPWQRKHQLLAIGLQGKNMEMDQLPPAHLTFLIDVSGSMEEPNKLPLVQRSLKVLVEYLRPEDRVSIITYSNDIVVRLSGAPGTAKEKITSEIDRLHAYGGTAGGPALKRAYEVATQHFVQKGNNRILLCTDGDFNLGFSSNSELVQLVEQERDKGVYLSLFGFGMGNYKDQKLMEIAKHGNGNYAYVDTILEAKRIFGEALAGTLFTVADNVKIQVEFNPAKVAGYRLLGYEKRLLRREDFNDDSKDAAEIGAGQRVTALYEIVPAGVALPESPDVDPLKYQQTTMTTAATSKELLTLKLRYILPQSGETSQLLERAVTVADFREATSDNFRLAAAAAGFGLLLRDSKYKGDLSWDSLQELAASTVGYDPNGHRKELCVLIRNAGKM